VPLPPLAASRLSESRLIDRRDELAQCTAAFEHVRDGERRTISSSGSLGSARPGWRPKSPGCCIGSEQLSCAGRCDAELGVPYQPFVELLTHYARFAPQELLASIGPATATSWRAWCPSWAASPRGPGSRLAEQSREEKPARDVRGGGGIAADGRAATPADADAR